VGEAAVYVFFSSFVGFAGGNCRMRV